jgi:hypothetical protein
LIGLNTGPKERGRGGEKEYWEKKNKKRNGKQR